MSYVDQVRLAHSVSNDREAAQRLVEMVLPRIRHTVRLLVGAHPGAEDLVQATLVEVLSASGGYRGEASLKTWADGVTYRVVMRQMKRLRRREQCFPSSPPPDTAGDSSVDGEVRRNVVRGCLAAHFASLKRKHRETLVLRLVLGHSVPEVASITGVRLNTARGRIRSGLKELRRRILSDETLVAELERMEP